VQALIKTIEQKYTVRNKPNKNCENTINDSRFRPLVTNVKPCVSMATPVRWTCSSTYLANHATTTWL